MNHQHNPFLLKGVGRWINVLHRVKGLPIAIIPNYDADGVLSGTLASVGLYLFGFEDVYLYPPKTYDGYGLSRKSVDNVLQARPETRVIITTDNGSNAHDGWSHQSYPPQKSQAYLDCSEERPNWERCFLF